MCKELTEFYIDARSPNADFLNKLLRECEQLSSVSMRNTGKEEGQPSNRFSFFGPALTNAPLRKIELWVNAPQLRLLRLSHNNLSGLNFANCQNVMHMDLTDNELPGEEAELFFSQLASGCPNLISLIFEWRHNNKLRRLPPLSFQNLEYLQIEMKQATNQDLLKYRSLSSILVSYPLH